MVALVLWQDFMVYFSEQWYGGLDDMTPRVFDAVLDHLDLKASRMNTSSISASYHGAGGGRGQSSAARGGTSSPGSRKDRLGEVRANLYRGLAFNPVCLCDFEVFHSFDIDNEGTVDRNELLALGR